MKRFWLATTVMACALLVSPASEAGQRSRPSGAESGGTAVPRGGGSSGGGSSGGGSSGGGSTAAPAPSRAGSSGRATSGDSGGSRAVPRGERPRDGRATVGQAVPRTRPPYGGGGGGGGVYYPGDYYWWSRPSYLYGYGALGLGYFYYDPFWWGVPYAGYGYPYYGGGYPYGGYSGYPYGGGYYGSGGSYQAPSGYEGVGQLRLKVTPKDADVYVDGYRVGIVTNFDGMFQRLDLTAGPHKVEIRKDGYETLSIDVRILPDETTTYEGELKPVNETGSQVR